VIQLDDRLQGLEPGKAQMPLQSMQGAQRKKELSWVLFSQLESGLLPIRGCSTQPSDSPASVVRQIWCVKAFERLPYQSATHASFRLAQTTD
jgi:hypothetical protein